MIRFKGSLVHVLHMVNILFWLWESWIYSLMCWDRDKDTVALKRSYPGVWDISERLKWWEMKTLLIFTANWCMLLCVCVCVHLGPGQWQHSSVCEEQISVWASAQPPAALPRKDDGEISTCWSVSTVTSDTRSNFHLHQLIVWQRIADFEMICNPWCSKDLKQSI